MVIYDPADPSDIRTPREQNLPSSTTALLVVALIVSVLLLVGGIVVILRARRWRRLLVGSPWQPYRARYLRAVRRGRFSPLNPGVELSALGNAAGSPIVLRVANTWRWRADRLRSCSGKTLWVTGDPAGQVVLAIPATRELLAAGPPRRALASAYAAAAGEPLKPDPRKAKKALRTVSILLVAKWALACVIVIWQTHANDIALALLALYTVGIAATLVTLRRAQQKATPNRAPARRQRDAGREDLNVLRGG